MTNKKMIATAILIVLIGAMIALPVMAEQAAPAAKAPLPVRPLLDGKTFNGKLTLKDVVVSPTGDPQDKKLIFDESIAFKDGTLISEFFAAKGYDAFPYSAKKDGTIINFMATSKGADNPKMVLIWEGRVVNSKTTGDQVLIGTVKLMQDEKAIEEYAIDTRLKAPVETPTAK